MTATPATPFRKWQSVLAVMAGVGGAIAALSQVSQFVRDKQWADLVVGTVGVVLVAAIAAFVVLRIVGGFHGTGGASPGQVLGVSITFSVLLVLGSLAVAAWIVDGPVGPAPSPPGPTSAAAPPLVSRSPAASGGPPWTETFDGNTLDPGRWGLPTSPDLIAVAGGRLEFRVTPAVTPEAFQRATLAPKLPAGAYSEVSLSATVSQVTPSDGGVDLIVRQDSGRESRIRMGPSPNGPGAEPWVCLRLPCGHTYDEFDHPTPAPFAQGQPAQIAIVQTGTRVELRAAGIVNIGPEDPSPIVAVEFLIEAGRGEEWLVTVDALRACSETCSVVR